jgi:hypothetical protein
MRPSIDGCGEILVCDRFTYWMNRLLRHHPYLQAFFFDNLIKFIQYVPGDVVIAMTNEPSPVKVCKRIVCIVSVSYNIECL